MPVHPIPEAQRFMPLNADKRRPHNVVDMPPSSYRPSPPSSRPPEPDRAQIDIPFEPPKVEKTLRSAPEPAAREEAPEVAAKKVKKKRTLVTDEQRVVAVARVEKLIAAGNPAGEATATVAKEFGVSESAVINWRTVARKQKPGKKASKRAPKREAGSPKPANGAAASPVPVAMADIGEALVELLTNAMAHTVRIIVREEIRRMLS
jgi:uncharacterized protein YoaH (UPF0181 family)